MFSTKLDSQVEKSSLQKSDLVERERKKEEEEGKKIVGGKKMIRLAEFFFFRAAFLYNESKGIFFSRHLWMWKWTMKLPRNRKCVINERDFCLNNTFFFLEKKRRGKMYAGFFFISSLRQQKKLLSLLFVFFFSSLFHFFFWKWINCLQVCTLKCLDWGECRWDCIFSCSGSFECLRSVRT